MAGAAGGAVDATSCQGVCGVWGEFQRIGRPLVSYGEGGEMGRKQQFVLHQPT